MREMSRDKTKMEPLKRTGTGSEVRDLGVQLLKPKASWSCLHLTRTFDGPFYALSFQPCLTALQNWFGLFLAEAG